MIDLELYAQQLAHERESYFATPEFKNRAAWRRLISSATRRVRGRNRDLPTPRPQDEQSVPVYVVY
jgi:hypothetical protein